MNDTLKRNIEDRILELQNDGQRYNLYQPVLEEIIADRHATNRGIGNDQTMVDHCIELLQDGCSTSFLTKEHYKIFKQCIGVGWPSDAQMRVIGGLLSDYYREWKYQNTNKQEAAEYWWKPTADDLAMMEDAIEGCKLVKSGSNPCLEITLDTTNLKLKDITMTIKIETKLFYNGVDIKNYTDDQLFGEIAKAEAEVERLEKIATKPKKLEAKIKELKDGIAQLAAAIDAR